MRVAFQTFGCKANQYDTERMRQELEARGWAAAGAGEDAELWVVNTCTVTNQADAQARRFVRKLERESPDTRVIVAGCSTALRAPEYRAMPGVSGVVEGHDPVAVAVAAGEALALGRDRAPASLRDPAHSPARASADASVREPSPASARDSAPPPARDSAPALVQLSLRGYALADPLLDRREAGTRGWLKVQDGCDRKCSFCATRLARGRSRSRPPAEVVAEARLLSASHPELVLTGIHIGHYGLDLDRRTRLSDLTARLLDEVPDVRFRLGSVEATEVDDLLLELLADSEGRLAPHLHMPLQSGADPVLRRMRRWHTREMYRERALEIAERMGVGSGGRLGLGADVITGFPGETEADHAETVALVEELPFTYLHVFPFSPREGTAAAELADEMPVPQRVAGERARELRELAQSKGERYRRQRAGGRALVVVEGAGRTALTGDYLRVRVRGESRQGRLPDAGFGLQEVRLVEEGGELSAVRGNGYVDGN